MRFQQKKRDITPIIKSSQSNANPRSSERLTTNANIFTIHNHTNSHDKDLVAANSEPAVELLDKDSDVGDEKHKVSSKMFVKTIQTAIAKVPSALKCHQMSVSVSKSESLGI